MCSKNKTLDKKMCFSIKNYSRHNIVRNINSLQRWHQWERPWMPPTDDRCTLHLTVALQAIVSYWFADHLHKVNIHMDGRSNLVIHVFDDEQNRTVHICQVSVQSLEAGPVSLSAVGQSPGVTLHTGWQATGELENKQIISSWDVQLSMWRISYSICFYSSSHR